MELFEKLRLCQVKRYPICHTNRDQNVAEHSFNVLIIAMELAAQTGDKELMVEVISYAIMHDMEEIYTGDIPSPFKRQLRAECPSAAPLLDGLDHPEDEVRAIVKLADYLEAIWYIREFGGSRLAESIKEDIAMNFQNAIQTTKARPEVVNAALSFWRSL